MRSIKPKYKAQRMLLEHRKRIGNEIDDLKITLTRIDEKLGRYDSIIKNGYGLNKC